ncbi:AsnC family transcriptional regulator [Azoarcus indigens]|uniref:siroheme decarboxylase n=1 Tax=Azoarcus indigens TaxID=29545 RepID=A0A4R6EF44_9RHOO|nr:AsnC family transcriptional regulator [Azoarcus indigens]NMG67593.1 AsnC family transcriptional regulator [Azoarcus indigens]TDN56119.1 AsnC family transcriptional regulator [Azoarcus indigens]
MNAPTSKLISNAPISAGPLLDETDRRLIRATQGGLPLVPQPYLAIAEQLGIGEAEVATRLAAMLENGLIRRIGAVPNHYALGYTANGMSVWDVDDEVVDAAGERIGALACVTHCYRRPRHRPHWPYNLFAMVHGGSREEVRRHVADILLLLMRDFTGRLRGHEVLFSTAILKKTGLRLRD